MFPDAKKMDEILQAFKKDPSIPKRYKERARTSYEGPNYIVIGDNVKFSVGVFIVCCRIRSQDAPRILQSQS